MTHRLPPRATIVPALPRSVFFQNHRDSELIQSFNGDFRFCYREEEGLVFVSEWMQNDPYGWDECAKRGSDNSIFVTRVEYGG